MGVESVVDDLASAAVVPAMEANFVRWWAHFAHAPQAHVHDEPELLWLRSGIPIPEYNGVVRTQLKPDRSPSEISGVIAATVGACAPEGVGMSWYISPSSHPADLGAHLLDQGLVYVGAAPGMAIDLAASQVPWRETEPLPTPGLPRVTRVSNPTLLRQWAEVAAKSYGEPAPVRQARFEVHASLGWEPDSALQRYVALLDGDPVATAALFFGGGVAGVYEVATVPQRRRQGLATSLMLAVLQAARERGYRIAALQASPMGEPLYRGLGFETRCAFHLYRWLPTHAHTA